MSGGLVVQLCRLGNDRFLDETLSGGVGPACAEGTATITDIAPIKIISEVVMVLFVKCHPSRIARIIRLTRIQKHPQCHLLVGLRLAKFDVEELFRVEFAFDHGITNGHAHFDGGG